MYHISLTPQSGRRTALTAIQPSTQVCRTIYSSRRNTVLPASGSGKRCVILIAIYCFWSLDCSQSTQS